MALSHAPKTCNGDFEFCDGHFRICVLFCGRKGSLKCAGGSSDALSTRHRDMVVL